MPGKSNRWDGRTVHVSRSDRADDRRTIDLAMTPATAHQLALYIKKSNQTYLMHNPVIDEIEAALDYVLIGDPVSVAKHQRMEAGKGMEPAGGDPKSYMIQHAYVENVELGKSGRCAYLSENGEGVCWSGPEAHDPKFLRCEDKPAGYPLGDPNRGKV